MLLFLFCKQLHKTENSQKEEAMQEVLAQCDKKGSDYLYEDPDFPPTQKSLGKPVPGFCNLYFVNIL